MGMGIVAREERCRRYWIPHLKLSREFIKRALPIEKSCDSIAVLGAGRLLDIDTEWLKRYKRIYLYDADPGSQKVWSSFAKGVGKECSVVRSIIDLTGVLDRWSKILNGSKCSYVEELIGALKEILLIPISLPELPECADLLSLNLLSQIQIYWRDRVLAYAKKHKIVKHSSDEELVLLSLNEMAVRLEEDHLKLITRIANKRIVILTDVEFYYYEKDRVEWQVEAAISQSAREVIQGDLLGGFKRSIDDRWLWHLAPQCIEDPSYGEIHCVNGVGYSRP